MRVNIGDGLVSSTNEVNTVVATYGQWLEQRTTEKRILGVENNIGEKLVNALKNPQDSESLESFAKAMEITKAYASSGSATHFSAVTRLFYDLFEMFETGGDPRQK